MTLLEEKQSCLKKAKHLYKHLGELQLAQCFAKINNASNGIQLDNIMKDFRQKLL